MEGAISYLDARNVTIGQMGENGHYEYKDEDVGDALVGLDNKCIRGFDVERIPEFLQKIVKENQIGMILRHLAFVRDIEKGKGEREVYYHYVYHLFCIYPVDVIRVLGVITKEFGSWRDVKGLLAVAEKMKDYQFRGVILDLIKSQLEQDRDAENPSFLGKYLPGEKASNTSKEMAKLIAKTMFTGKDKFKNYRKLKSSLTAKINLLERNLCGNTRENIDCSKIPAGAMKKYRASLSNTDKNGKQKSTVQDRVDFALRWREHLEGRVASGKGVSSRGMEIRSVVKMILDENGDETLIRGFLQDLEGKLGDLSKVIPVVDTSASMFGKNGEIYAALGLGVLVSQRTMVPFRDRMITFSAEPSWFRFNENDTFEERVKKAKEAEWGGDTNYYSTGRLIINALQNARVPPEEVSDLIMVVFSDMQFNQSMVQEQKGQSLMTNMQDMFNDAGYDAPTLVFWNLRGNTTGSPVMANEKNVVQVSGFNQNMMNSFLANPRDMNPKTMLKKVLMNPRYNVVDK